MEIYRSQIEKNFYHDLFKLTWINQKDVVENHENYDKIINQICNLESNNILSLSDKRTYLLRKRLGIYDEGKIVAQNKISVDMNVGIDYVKKTICQIYNDLSKAVHYNILTPEEYLSKNRRYFIYCDSGSKSRKLCLHLSNLGYDVVDLVGGIKEYLV